MTRARRLLLIAFALSLLIHVLVAVIVRPAAPSRENQTEVVSIEHRRAVIALMKKLPTPPPPRPHPLPRRAPAPAPPRKRAPVAVARGPGPGGGGRGIATASPATPVPEPIATPVPRGCAQPNAAAAVVATPPPPDIASDARVSATSGTALVKVQLDASGGITDTSVTQTTGNSSLDLVAVAMARDARYSPALHDCKPIAGIYTFSVKFVAW